MHPTPLKSMRATLGAPPPPPSPQPAIAWEMRSRTTRPVGRVTRTVYTPEEDSRRTAWTSMCWITAPAPGIPESTHSLDQRRLQRRCVSPAVAEPLRLRRLQGMPESHARVRHRDHHHPPRERAPPMVALHRHPAARPRVLYNILTRLRKRHSEAHRRLRVELQLGRQNGGRPLLNPAHDLVHGFGGPHGGDRKEHVALFGGLAFGDAAVDLE